jgi:type II secretory pathway pseudopilin PulG
LEKWKSGIEVKKNIIYSKAVPGFSIVEAIVSMVLMSIFISGLFLTWMNLSYRKNEIYHYQAIHFAEQLSDSVRSNFLTESFLVKQKNLNADVRINLGEKNMNYSITVKWKRSKETDQLVCFTGSYFKPETAKGFTFVK